MSETLNAIPGSFRLRLPATSANLGSGFDAAAVALDFYLEIDAEPAAEFSIAATGRDSEQCSRLENNLILGIYKDLLAGSARTVIPLTIRMTNDIPLGMGCGSSAAGRLAAIALAVHFGRLGVQNGFWKRLLCSKAIRTMLPPAGSVGLSQLPAKEEQST
jgi:homoserine kinase